MSRSFPDATVVYPEVPTAVWIDNLVRATNVARSYKDSYIELDLSRLTKISPIFLCFLAAVIEEGLLDRGNRFLLSHPHSRRAAEILRKAKFMEERPEKIESRFLQVRRLSRGRVLTAHDIVEFVGENLRISQGIRRLMNVILSELFQNAIDHSGRDACYVCAGMWGKSKQVHISVVDFGVGIPNKLRSMYQHEIAGNDDRALRLVLEEARSTRARKIGGRGYAFIQSVLRANKGRLCIYSGQSKASYRYDRGEYPITKKREFFGGTAVDIQINKDEKSYYRLIDEQEEVFF